MKNSAWTIPNSLTIIRLILVPIFVVVFLQYSQMLALSIFIVAAFTDVLDGHIARTYNLVSDIGKVLDPLADKAMRLSAIAVFYVVGVLPLWVLIAVACFDLFLVVTSIILYQKKYVPSSNGLGKLAAFGIMFSLTLCFFAEFLAPWHLIMVYISLGLILASVFGYILKTKKSFISKK